MRLLFSWTSVVAFGLLLGCSSDEPGAVSGDGGANGAGGKAPGTGGKAGAGGRSSAGGMVGAGGFDPTLAVLCGVDAGADTCRSCLAVKCCDAALACETDEACSVPFESYQACVKVPGGDVSECYAEFGRTVRGDSGIRTHEPVLTCVLTSCEVCGAPSIF